MPKSETESANENGRISTQASSVYDRLQADILTGKLKPGLKLRLKDLIERYETGNSPLREALNRLSANGMVLREENRGDALPTREKWSSTPRHCCVPRWPASERRGQCALPSRYPH